jgi:hypothetical protein
LQSGNNGFLTRILRINTDAICENPRNPCPLFLDKLFAGRKVKNRETRWTAKHNQITAKTPSTVCCADTCFSYRSPILFSTVSFVDAITPEQANADNMPLPSGWTAGVMNHGSYYKWWTIQQRPILFGVSLFILVAALLFVWISIFWIWKQDHINQCQDG